MKSVPAELVKIPKWDTRSLRGVHTCFSKIRSPQVVLVLNLITGSILPHYHVVFDDLFSIVVSTTFADPEDWIRLATTSNSRIQVVLYQEDDSDFYDYWLTAN